MPRDNEKIENYGESMRSDSKPDSDEGLNRYYNRKQKTKESDFACDVDSEPAPPDRDAEYANYKSDRDAGPMNTPWARERYGRGR